MRTTTLFLALSLPVVADDADLAKKLANPVADLISVPIQSNYDFGIGPGDGTKWTTNIQPVIPFGINEYWNVISRTILPVIDQEGIALGGFNDAFGIGDTVQLFAGARYYLETPDDGPEWGLRLGITFLFPKS
jgi:hypothetical protein